MWTEGETGSERETRKRTQVMGERGRERDSNIQFSSITTADVVVAD